MPRRPHLTTSHQRPASARTRGVVVVGALLLAGCSGGVPIDSPDLSADDARACAELVAALPDTLAGEPRRDVTPDDAPGAAWGDEPIVLTCGVGLPSAYDEFSSCSVIEDVGWFLPPEQLSDPSADIVATALTHSPRVSVRIPAAHRGSDAVQVALSRVIGETLVEDEPCV